MTPRFACQKSILSAVAALVLFAPWAIADPQPEVVELFEDMTSARAVQWEGVQMLEVTKTIPSTGGFSEFKELYEVVWNTAGAGPMFTVRLIPPEEVERRMMEANTGKKPDEMAKFLQAYARTSYAFGEDVELAGLERMFPGRYRRDRWQEDNPAVNPDSCNDIARWGKEARSDQRPITLEVTVDEETGKGEITGQDVDRSGFYYYLSPMTMMTENACFLLAAEAVMRAENQDVTEETRQIVEQLNAVIEAINYGGMEQVNGKAAHKLEVTGANLTQTTDDGSVTMHNMYRLIDPDHYYDVLLRMEGTMTSDGKTRDIYLEREPTDYRQVPGGNLYAPYKELLRMGGMLSETDRARLAENEAKLAEFEQQMASMPPDQRAMVERMMGPQLEQMKSLVNDGTFEIEIVTTNIVINPDLKIDAANRSGPMSEQDLLIQIQHDLDELGYDPGNTIGNLSRETVAAIISFQRDNNLALTGKPSPQLAGILAAKVKNDN